jgi:agmatinase
MEAIKFLTIPSASFSGFISSYEDSHFIVFGVPFDSTSSYKPGSRFGPSAIREASYNIETFSMRTMEDVEKIKVCDVGDLLVTHGNIQETNKNVERLASEILKGGKFPIMLGGEHSVTYGAVKALGKDTTVIQFDAHMDLRNEYLGEKWSHATVMRRILEEVGTSHIIEAGIRAPSREEYQFAKENKISFFTSEALNTNWDETTDRIKELIEDSTKIYLSVDVDCLDPSVAPGVGNPEPEGINLTTLINMIQKTISPKIKGFDIVEVSPPNDPSGITSVAAAKLAFELITMLDKTTTT